MTKHLPSQLKVALTLPIGMSDAGGFAAATQSAKSMLFYVACQSRFAQLRRHRMVMAAEITRLQPWLDITGNFKSP